MKVIDLFCGSGGFSEGFKQAGFDVIWAVDNWKPAVDTHSENHPSTRTILDDVIRLSNLNDSEFDNIIPDSEIIIGSPPCIAFSNSNKSGNGDKTKGIELFEAFLRIVHRKKYKRKSKLKYWILENVPNIEFYIKDKYSANNLGIKGRNILKVKYENSTIYNSKYYKVPSNRKRFFCGYFPTPEKIIKDDKDFISLSNILEGLGEPKQNMENIINDSNYPTFSLRSKYLADHHYIKEITKYQWEKAKRLKQDKGYMGRMSFPENLDKPSRVIMATISYSARESLILGYKKNRYRAPTIREVASLMSFPIDYRFYGISKEMKYRLVGNSVPPKISFAFAKAIAKKEKIKYNSNYSTIKHLNKVNFKNINFDIFSLNKEKPKKITTKFTYHVPYLIIDTFRVELTNRHSDFDNNKFKWSVEIHKSQGPKARVYIPRLNKDLISNSNLIHINKFINSYKNKIVYHQTFQKIHCMTTEEIIKKDLIGPYELLYLVKDFIGNLNSHPQSKLKINYENDELLIPYKIMMVYYILKKLLK